MPGIYRPFSEVTEQSLEHTLIEEGLSLGSAETDSLMQAYDHLSTFSDVAPTLKALAETPEVTAVVFSNGTLSMVSNSVQRSADLAPYANVFNDIVVVEEEERFKPDPRVYKMLARRVGKDERSLNDIWLVSGNPFDIVGARAAGLNGAWIDRSGRGWSDRLCATAVGKPSLIVSNLQDVVAAIRSHLE